MSTPLELLERLLEKYRGAARPAPTDLSVAVEAFALQHPEATPSEWAAFATRLASNAWRDGFLHGQVAASRSEDLEWLKRANESRDYAEVQSELWRRMREAAPPGQPLAELPTDTAIAEAFDAMGRVDGGYRVVIIDGDKRDG